MEEFMLVIRYLAASAIICIILLPTPATLFGIITNLLAAPMIVILQLMDGLGILAKRFIITYTAIVYKKPKNKEPKNASSKTIRKNNKPQ